MGYTLYVNDSAPSAAITCLVVAKISGEKVAFKKGKPAEYTGKSGSVLLVDGKSTFISGLADVISTLSTSSYDDDVRQWVTFMEKDYIPHLETVLHAVIAGTPDKVDPNEVKVSAFDELSVVMTLNMMVGL